MDAGLGKSQEGAFAVLVALAVSKGVDMPICYAMDQILNRGVAVDEAIHELLDRPIKEELDFS